MRKETVLIIGGGLGGISAAITMAAEGYNVKLFEKNSHLGGKLNELKKNGFSFDLGPSILTLPHIFAELFAMHNKEMEDYIKIEKLDLQWRCFFEDGEKINLYSDLDKMNRQNNTLTDKDIDTLKDYLEYSGDIYQLVEDGYFSEGLDTMGEIIRHYGPFKAVRGLDYFSTMADGVERYIDNQYLQNVINVFIKYVGSSPYAAPAVLNLLPYVQYKYGLWYVPGGMYKIAEGFEKLMNEVGIEIYKDSEVTGIDHNDNLVEAITLADGTRITGDHIISNMEVIPAYKNLLDRENFVKKYDKFEPACSGYVLHLAVDREYPQLAHHNFFFAENHRKFYKSVFEDYKIPEDPTIYLVASTRTDSSQAPDGCENIKVLPHIPHLLNSSYDRNDLRKLRERVLTKLERMGLKDLRNHIIFEDEWTPFDIKDMYYSNGGDIYGVVSDRKKNNGFKAPKQSEVFSNLYFVGGSVNPGGGMPMVLLSGQKVKDRIE